MTNTPADPNPSFCSFCARKRSNTSPLVAGPGVAICGSCVQLAESILNKSTNSDGLPQNEGPWLTMTDDQLLAHLPQVAAVGGQVESRLRAWVNIARERNISWAKVGNSLNMTRQSAWERFHRPPDNS